MRTKWSSLLLPSFVLWATAQGYHLRGLIGVLMCSRRPMDLGFKSRGSRLRLSTGPRLRLGLRTFEASLVGYGKEIGGCTLALAALPRTQNTKPTGPTFR